MSRPRVLILDNYDSFAGNLYQFLGELGAEPLLRRNDRDIFRDDLPSADEAFLTGSLMEVLPLCRLGNGRFRPGPLAAALRQRLAADPPPGARPDRPSLRVSRPVE